MQLYNTLTQKEEPLKVPSGKPLGLYVCGITPYDFAHLGHVRAYVVYDVLVRQLRAAGVAVKYVRNITDVNDTLIARAKAEGTDAISHAARFYAEFCKDMERVGNLLPDAEPKVSDHIDGIIELIGTLIDREVAYAVDGDVYFHVSAFPAYGKLSHRCLADLEAGASGRTEETEDRRKRNTADFALWKGCSDTELGWTSPWGYGRPGWHIECSVMSMAQLGPTIDLHGGGLDLVFPHHENEIAQSEAATGQPYVRHFMHNGFVQLNKEKMSKSLGNFFTARQVFGLVAPEAVRYALLGVHYRAPFNLEWTGSSDGPEGLTFPTFDEAERRLEYIYRTRKRLAGIPEGRRKGDGDAPEDLSQFDARLHAALEDDLSTPTALAVTSDFLHAVNHACDKAMAKKGKIPPRWMELAEAGFRGLAQRLGVGGQEPDTFLNAVRDRRALARGIDGAAIEAKIAERLQARQDRDFAKADSIRDELLAQGIELLDGTEATNWQLN